MSLQPITACTFYLPGANNLGVVATGDGGAILIDSGLDKDVGRKLRKALDAAGLTLRAIINTHHHADHIGGNAYLVRNIPGLPVYAPPIEAALIETPALEPVYLNYGASPHKALQTRWLMAQGTPVQHIIGAAEPIQQGGSFALEVAGVSFEVIGLPGHSPAQIGLVCDGVCFAADGYFGAAIVSRHGLLYAHDIAAQLASFERLAARDEAWFLPGHGELVSRGEVLAVLAENRRATEQISDLLCELLAEPGSVDALTLRVLQRLKQADQPAGADAASPVAGMTIPQYVIFAGGVAAHLSFLEQQGRAQVALHDTGLIWHAA